MEQFRKKRFKFYILETEKNGKFVLKKIYFPNYSKTRFRKSMTGW